MRNFAEIIGVLILTIALSGCAKKNKDILYDRKYIEQIKEVRKDAVNYLVMGNIPGGSFAISKDGKMIYSEGIGFASKDLEVPVTRTTKFRIGSVTECFTALIYQMMVEKGVLAPDSAVHYYFPDFPNKQFKLTLDHLAYQTSGIRKPTVTETDWRAVETGLQEGIGLFKNDSLLYPPGMFQDPSMFNYNLLGAVLEKTSGKTYAQLLKEYITDTLHLTNTTLDNPLMVIKGRSDFYDLNFVAQLVNATFRDLRFRAPSEGLLSNAEDLVKLGNAMLDSPVISESVRESVLEPATLPGERKTAISKGWIAMTDKFGRKFYGRAGGVTGGSAALVVYPDEKLVFAATFNLTDKIGQFPIMEMAQKFLKTPEPNTGSETQTEENQ
jgi:CubicO group peptidase (beta-lactamase class C family)